MRRRLFSIASVASLLLLVATLAAWARGRWARDVLVREDQHGYWHFANFQGGILIDRVVPTSDDDWWFGRKADEIRLGWRYDAAEAGHLEKGPGEPRFNLLGIVAYTGERWMDDHHALFTPHWMIALATLLLPVGWFFTHSATRRRAGCRNCGYDLTGNTSGVCPECGTPVSRDRASA